MVDRCREIEVRRCGQVDIRRCRHVRVRRGWDVELEIRAAKAEVHERGRGLHGFFLCLQRRKAGHSEDRLVRHASAAGWRWRR
jgi:hypothetical protein